MGVDIRAFRQLTRVDCVFDAEGNPIGPATRESLENGGLERFYVNPDFPGRADDLEGESVYGFSESKYFLSRSYGGYNHLRNKLAKLAGYPEEGHFSEILKINERHHCWACWRGETGPFCEVINFSDCEGTIGASVSAKLAKDFADFQDKADLETDDNFKQFYSAMRGAFEMASDGGAVRYS